MAKQFEGRVGLDIRDSVPDWTPYVQPKAPDGAPNVLWIVWDDVGFGAMEPFGGLIETPTMKRLADGGLRYTQMHTTALCSPTRACLLTGRNATTVGMACIEEANSGFPNGNGHIPFETATLAEVLSERGWSTYCVGKWHLCPSDEMNMASTKRNWPTGRGFERFYGFLGGETNQWYPNLVRDQQQVEQPYYPRDAYHFSKDLVDNAISMIADSKQIAPDKPFFMYLAPGAGHAPHHVFKEWADRYAGRFSMGYERYREQVLDNMKRMGIVPKSTELPPLNPMSAEKSPEGTPWPVLDTMRPWDGLNDGEKRLFERMAEVYAGYVSYTDHEIGRLVDYLERTGQLDNTIVVAISDNGASGEGGPNGSVNENLFFNGVADDLQRNLQMLDQLGSKETYNHYPTGWATAFCTPFKMYKRFSWNGGICDPMIVHWPKGIAAKGELRSQYHHAIDVMPTVLECLGIEAPDEVKGYTQWPIEGASMRYTFEQPRAESTRDTQFYSMLGTRGIYHKGWKADTVHPALGDWRHFDQDRWLLYNVQEDVSQVHDLSQQEPGKLEELKELWFHEAGKYKGFPVDDRTTREIMTEVHPQVAPPRDRYVYAPGGGEVPETVAPIVRGRSWKIAADARIDTPEAGGVIVSQGSKFGGHALYVKDARLCYANSFIGIEEQILRSDDTLPTGSHVLGVTFEVGRIEQQEAAAYGTARLWIDEREAGRREIRTQLGTFSLVGEGLNVGRDMGSPVTDDYPADRPWAFTGGTIERVVFDLSGEPYANVEREVAAMFARE